MARQPLAGEVVKESLDVIRLQSGGFSDVELDQK
jgi:hypothetical protein